MVWVVAAITALIVALLATAMARRLLGAHVGAIRGLIVGVVFYLAITPTLNTVAVAAALVDETTEEVIASTGAIIAVLVLSLAWAFLLGLALLVVAEVMVPTGSVDDPVTAVRHWIARRRRTRRFAQVGSVFARAGLRTLLRGDPRRASGPELGDALAQTLQSAGVTFVKFGQVLSTRDDLLPPAVVERLATLRDDVAPEPWERMRTVLDSDVPGWSESLEIEQVPLAAASIGQVHRAKLRDGTVVRDVVVKIQRPGARETVLVDTDILQRLAGGLENRTEWAREMDVSSLVRGFSAALVEELDYRREAENVGYLAHAKGVRVPRIFPGLGSSRVLVMERIDGVTLTHARDRLAALGDADRAGLARTLMSSVLDALLVKGVFHADLHPGNVVLTPSGELALLDFGSVGVLDREVRELLLGLLTAIDAQDSASAVTLLLRLLPPGRYDSYALRRDLGAALTLMGGSEGFSPSDLARFFGVFRTHRLALPPHVAGALRTFGSLQGCLAILSPGEDLRALVREGTRSAAVALAEPRTVGTLALSRTLATAAVLSGLPASLDAMLRDVTQGRLVHEAVRGARAIARDAARELVPTIVASVLVLAAVGLFAVRGGPMLTQTVSWATYLAAAVAFVGGSLVLRVLFRQFHGNADDGAT